MPRKNTERLSTDAWVLELPTSLTAEAPVVCVPTIHPRGDRRVISCVQAALNAGYRVRIIWLGSGTPSSHPLVEEILLPEATSTRERIRFVKSVARLARARAADVWHIHDFYMLRHARAWHRHTGNPVLYDVHEYYADYYSAKLPLPRSLRRLAAVAIEDYQVRSAAAFGGANVVAERMAETFRARGVPTSVSPNYPREGPLRSAGLVPFTDRRYRVLHMGTLTPDYGTETLVRLAARSAERGLPFRFDAVARFPTLQAQRDFESLVASARASIDVVPTRPAHEMPAFVSQYGFGLSLLADEGQNDNSVPAKNIEHILLALVAVVTDRPAQREFVEEWGVSAVLQENDIDHGLDEMLAIADAPEITGRRLQERAANALTRLTWEGVSEPAIVRLYRQLDRGDSSCQGDGRSSQGPIP